ncbi:MAG: recombinase family protein [Firmicutes bacterium]|nr:recombinase family protein [Bacillota bacterium]
MFEKKYRAVKYIRLSHADDGDGESNSVVNQRKLLDSFLSGQPDIEAAMEKVDDGFSGILFDRPAFREMMAEIEAGNIDCVVVKDLSRFGREYIETGRYLQRIFPAYGVRFIAVNDNIDTLRDRSDDLVVSVKSIINDAYCRDISVKTRSALNVKRGNGDYVGACPVYGYNKAEGNKNRLAVDEYPAQIVRDIFRMKIEGMSAKRIAETLNSLGVLSPMAYKKDRGLPYPKNGFADRADAQWSPIAVIRILSDEVYTGALIQGKQGTLNYKIKDLINRPENEWARTDDAHEAIVSCYDFDLAQRIMRLDTRTAPGGDSVYLFSGVLICDSCGGRMTRKSNTVGGKQYHYYRCPTGKKQGCAHAVLLREDDLIACVLGSIKAHIANIASLESVLSNCDWQRTAAALVAQYAAQIAENERQLEKVSGFKSTLYENMISGLLSKDDYRGLKEKYVGDESRFRSAIEKLRQEREDTLLGKSERLKWAEHFRHFEGLTELDRKTVVNLIQSIRIISKTEIEIKFAYQDEFDRVLSLLGSEAA